MNKTIAMVVASLMVATTVFGQEEKTKDVVKTGYNFGPLPAVSYDEDKGFQYGALLQLYNYGDGSSYPMYKSKWYFEASAFTKGSLQFTVMYDKVQLAPGIRFCATAKYNRDTAYDFLGLGGYNSYYAADQKYYVNNMFPGFFDAPSNMAFNPFYKLKRNLLMTRADFIGEISDNLHWEAGYHFSWFDQGTIDYDSVNKGKSEDKVFAKSIPTLLDYYEDWGIIPSDEKKGGLYSCVRLGIEYDSRDKEGAPSRGIWAEGHVNISPKWLGSSSSSYRYSLTFRHYVPIVDNDVLTFAYRLNYEGTFGNKAPYYILPYLTVVSVDNDVEGMGGAKTCRGIPRGRIVGLDTAIYTAEIRWRFVKFQLWNQNMAFGLNLFSDGAMVTRPYDTSFNYQGTIAGITEAQSKAVYDAFITGKTDVPHITFGTGLRFIMNENFVVACDYGMPISRFYKDSNPLKGQDGKGGLYIGLGYLF